MVDICVSKDYFYVEINTEKLKAVLTGTRTGSPICWLGFLCITPPHRGQFSVYKECSSRPASYCYYHPFYLQYMFFFCSLYINMSVFMYGNLAAPHYCSFSDVLLFFRKHVLRAKPTTGVFVPLLCARSNLFFLLLFTIYI